MTARRLTVLIADDHPVYRRGLERAISERPELDLVASSADGREALERITQHEPDVAVVDVRMPGLDGLKIVGAVRRDGLRTKVVLLTGYEDSAAAYQAITQGAAGYVSKASEHTDLCDAVIKVADGETVVAPQFQAAIAREIKTREGSQHPAPSEREIAILRLLAEGRTLERIAAELGLSQASAEAHLGALYEKLEVSDRAAAVATAMRRGLLE
jgi:two-component system, NarL family, nitrate/nitrite response regulator NarL